MVPCTCWMLYYQNCHKRGGTPYWISENAKAENKTPWEVSKPGREESTFSREFVEAWRELRCTTTTIPETCLFICLFTFDPLSTDFPPSSLRWNLCFSIYSKLLNAQGPLPLPTAPMGLANLAACSNVCLFTQHSMVQWLSQVSRLFIRCIPLTVFQSFVC